MTQFSGLRLMSKVLPITVLALSSLNNALPSHADFADLSSSNLSGLTYTNTGTSINTSQYGEAAGSGAVTNPSTETDVNLVLYLPKTVAMAINSHTSGTFSPGGIFGAAAVPISRTTVREDHEAILNGSNTEFIIRGVLASNVDAVALDFDPTVTLTHASGSVDGVMTLNIAGFGAAGVAGMTSATSISTGASLDTNTGLAGFRLEGNIDTASVSRSADRAGQYNGSITITATTQ
jgi:hypothetical protein